MKNVISFDTNLKEDHVQNILNMDFFTNKSAALDVPYTEVMEEPSKPKRGRPKKKVVNGQQLITGEEDQKEDLEIYKTNEPYLNTYDETTNMLKTSVYQIDLMQNDIKSELDQIRLSKTLKRKYDYISMLSSTYATLIGTKVTAVREMNKTITDSHNLELKRLKDLKMDASEQDDDKRIMDLYNAYISTPVGNYQAPSMAYQPPGITDMTLLNNNDRIMQTQIMPTINQGYEIDPSINRMLLMENPNIKTVVVYDSTTGDRHFDVINTQTGESVPGVDRPDSMFLNDTTLDTRNGIARNINLDQTYPLIIMDNPNINKY